MEYGNGTKVRYVYDVLDRISQLWYTEDNSETLRYEYTYISKGQIFKIEDYAENISYLYKYDEEGRLSGHLVCDTDTLSVDLSTQITYTDKSQLDSVAYGFDYVYDNSSITYGEIWNNYDYDESGNLILFGIWGDSIVDTDISYTYDFLQLLKKKEIQSGLFNNTISYTYKDRSSSLTTAQISDFSTQVNNNTATTFNYTYDANWNISRIVDGNGKITRYIYDNMNQLIREDNPYTNKTYKYIYDSNGNRLKKETYAYTTGTLGTVINTESFTYCDSSWGDMLTGVGGYTFTYDDVGNILTYEGYDLSWEGRKLSEISANGGQFIYSYKYNADGIRTSKTINGTEHKYALNGTRIFKEEWGNSTLLYLYDESGLPIGMKYRTSSYAKDVFDTYFFEKNLHGDIIAIYNAGGTKIGTYTYDAWGVCIVTYSSGISNAERSAVSRNPFRYRGYYLDSETGWYYLQSRYYNPGWGRFINADDYVNANGDIIGFNMYAYCSNNPVMGYDPTGNIVVEIVVGLLVVGGLAYALTACDSNSTTEYFEVEEIAYDSVESAVFAFGNAYLSKSILENREYGAFIYSLSKDGRQYYTYSMIAIGTCDTTKLKLPISIRDKQVAALVHTHAAHMGQYNDSFSAEDMKSAAKWGSPSYLFTTEQELYKYDPKNASIFIVPGWKGGHYNEKTNSGCFGGHSGSLNSCASRYTCPF